MPLSLFCDALPYNEMKKNYENWFDGTQISYLMPNIAYSSSLHWQLYCNRYPDERGVLVDWVREPEKNTVIRVVSTVLQPLDMIPKLGWFSRKVLDRVFFRRNAFANIPFKFRKDFTQKGSYLFWDKATYRKEELFQDWIVVSQDEGHKTFEKTISSLNKAIESKQSNIFAVFGFADSMGHTCRRGELYSKRLREYMNVLRVTIQRYLDAHPNESVLLISDHGMSTVQHRVDVGLEKMFGRQGKKTYIAYSDSAVMCVWCENEQLRERISQYLNTLSYGHLLTEEERKYYRAADRKFGDLLFILREGNVFNRNWFGVGVRRQRDEGSGMHGFWPEESALDQMATVVLINSHIKLKDSYDYTEVYYLIRRIMKGKKYEFFL